MALLFPDGVAGGVVGVGANAVAVHQADSTYDPFVLHGGFELVDAALEFFLIWWREVGCCARRRRRGCYVRRLMGGRL